MNRRHMLRSRYHFFYNFVSERRDSLTRNSRSDILLVLFYLIVFRLPGTRVPFIESDFRFAQKSGSA